MSAAPHVQRKFNQGLGAEQLFGPDAGTSGCSWQCASPFPHIRYGSDLFPSSLSSLVLMLAMCIKGDRHHFG
jgi:hypothetical protein